MAVSLISKVLYQIACGIRDMHALNLVHNDLKLENIIMFPNFKIQICDFGSTCHILENIKNVQTTYYINAPECFDSESFVDFSNDIWSIGVIALSLANGNRYFVQRGDRNGECAKIIIKNFKGIDKDCFVRNDLKSGLLFNLVKKILVMDKKLRPTIEDILKDEFIIKYNT